MKRNDGLDFAPGNLFTDGDPGVPTPASVLGAAWLNMVQEEIANAIELSGIALNGADDEQLYKAIVKIVTDKFSSAFKVFAGNPNGSVAGTQGNAGTGVFPTVCWDTTNKIWWVCTTTGNAATTVWEIVGDQPEWPHWCGTSTGTANAPVLATPVNMTAFATGTSISWKIGAGPNTLAVNVTVGAFGTWPLHKDGPAGPVALVGGELDVGNLCTARFDGTVLHLVSTELGTAAMADASSNTGKVAAVSGVVNTNRLAQYFDAQGTLKDGPALSSAQNVVAAVLGVTVANRLAVYADVNGTLQNGPAQSSLTGMLAAVSGATVIGNLPWFSDITGTLQDSGYKPSDFLTQAEAIMYRLGLIA